MKKRMVGLIGGMAALIQSGRLLHTSAADGSVGFSRWKPPVDEKGRIRNLCNHPPGSRAAKREKGRRKILGCEKCFKPLTQVNSLYRLNPKGESGEWVCDQCMSKSYKAEVEKMLVELRDALKNWKP